MGLTVRSCANPSRRMLPWAACATTRRPLGDAAATGMTARPCANPSRRMLPWA